MKGLARQPVEAGPTVWRGWAPVTRWEGSGLEDRGVKSSQPQGRIPMNDKPISDLRRRMLEDMAVRRLGEKTRDIPALSTIGDRCT
jgi:hypothetical protein